MSIFFLPEHLLNRNGLCNFLDDDSEEKEDDNHLHHHHHHHCLLQLMKKDDHHHSLFLLGLPNIFDSQVIALI